MEETSKRRGHLVGRYTTPPDHKEIEELTARYQIYAAAMTALWTALFFLFYQYLLRPVRNVTRYLELSRTGTPRLIPNPRGVLEWRYNELATRALLQEIEEKLNSAPRPADPREASHRAAAVASALQLAAGSFGVKHLLAAELAVSGEEMAVQESFSISEPEAEADALIHQRLRMLQQALAEANPDPEQGPPSEGYAFLSSNIFAFVAPVGDTTLLVTGQLAEGQLDMRTGGDTIKRACEAIRHGFMTYRAHRQDLVRHRSEANIVLSRNIGHDLTNIIATSKLDLMAVRRLLHTPVSGDQEQRNLLLQQSVKGLLENTRFLQEMVNIYRSFSHVKRPQYERRDLPGLIEEFLAAFEPSVSSRVQILRDFEANMPAPIVEPRLMKLALFNVITNALDSIKRSSEYAGNNAEITIRASYQPVGQQYLIKVDDNGPGIRDQAGRILTQVEIQAIFEYGYSTKAETSEGLGLSWVKTIIGEFHDGTVSADNRLEGGASISLLLKSMERSEAKVGNVVDLTGMPNAPLHGRADEGQKGI